MARVSQSCVKALNATLSAPLRVSMFLTTIEKVTSPPAYGLTDAGYSWPDGYTTYDGLPPSYLDAYCTIFKAVVFTLPVLLILDLSLLFEWLISRVSEALSEASGGVSTSAKLANAVP